MVAFDWLGGLAGPPLWWMLSGFATTLAVTIVASVLATLLTFGLIAARLYPSRGFSGTAIRSLVAFTIEVFRNTPLLIQLLFWYFAAYAQIPESVRQWIGTPHAWASLPGGVDIISPEFLVATWGMAIFAAAFLVEEIHSGIRAIPSGQYEAAASEGFGYWLRLRHILLPQALSNAWQPIIGQYLNLMKLTSLATSIGLAEVAYQVRQIESYNGHAFEAFAVGTLFYLLLGVLLSAILSRCDIWRAPGSSRQERRAETKEIKRALVSREDLRLAEAEAKHGV